MILISASSASGNTATVAAEVCRRPPVSVLGTRCTRWTPLSNFITPYTEVPFIENIISLNPPIPVPLLAIISRDQLFRSAYLLYIRKRSAANKAASSPPVPARISTIVFLSSLGSRGISKTFNSFPKSANSCSILGNSSIASSFNSSSSPSIMILCSSSCSSKLRN